MSKRKAIGVSLVVLVVGVFAAGAVLKKSGWSERRFFTSAAGAKDPVRNIKFAVYDAGIFPEQMEIEAGRISIVFDDRTGKNSAYVVQRINGNGAEPDGRVNARKDHWRTRTELKVTPGRYRIFASDNPEIQSTLIVNP